MFDVWTRADLLTQGWHGRAITRAVREGRLIRARQDRYLAPNAPVALVSAIRVGGRLGCISLLAELGVFVFDGSALHVHMQRGDSRMRSPRAGAGALPARRSRRGVVLHWHPLFEPASRGAVHVLDALVHAVRCQSPRHAIATLDSALNLRLIDEADVGDVFGLLPKRYGVLGEFLDGRAQAGTESLVRLMVLGFGCSVQLQVEFDDVGFVDLVVDEWLAIECDSKQFHSSWQQQLKDYRRDLALAKLGYCVLRLTAEDILYRPELVLASLRGLLQRRR